MLFNIVKCYHLHIGSHNIDTKYTIKSKDQATELETIEQEKDLGVIIDQKLTFRDHVNSKVNSANKNLGIIFRTFTFIDEEMFLNLCNKEFLDLLEFC